MHITFYNKKTGIFNYYKNIIKIDYSGKSIILTTMDYEEIVLKRSVVSLYKVRIEV